MSRPDRALAPLAGSHARTCQARAQPDASRSAHHALAQLDGALAQARQCVHVAGREFAFACLDDLDEAIAAQLARPATRTGGVAEVTPHFGVIWPSALALGQHLSERASGLAGRDVIELGCGLALPSMVARELGARRVVATDRHPLVPRFLARNAAANGVAGIEYAALDWRRPQAAGVFDVVVGSDLLYEAWQPGFLAETLARLVAPGGEAVIADPGRRYVDAFLALLEAEGFVCELASLRPIPWGSSRVEVLVIEARRG